MIDLQPSGEQQQIADAVGQFLREKMPVARHRKQSLGGSIDAALYQEIIGLGWIGLGVQEDAGGLGLSLIDDMLVCRELGRQLAPLSLFAAVAGARLAASSARPDLAKDIIAGRKTIAIALHCEPPLQHSALLVLDGGAADFILCLCGEFVIMAPAACLGPPERLNPIDASIDMQRRTWIGSDDDIISGLANGHRELLLLGSAFLVGMAEATRDMAVAYAKEREQFNQPIGAFQAIKHICADTALRAEAAKSQLFFAAIEQDNAGPHALTQVLAAKLLAADAALLNGAANIQVHGGFGFTAECDAHLYVKRAQVLEYVFGPQRQYQSVLGSLKAFSFNR